MRYSIFFDLLISNRKCNFFKEQSFDCERTILRFAWLGQAFRAIIIPYCLRVNSYSACFIVWYSWLTIQCKSGFKSCVRQLKRAGSTKRTFDQFAGFHEDPLSSYRNGFISYFVWETRQNSNLCNKYGDSGFLRRQFRILAIRSSMR